MECPKCKSKDVVVISMKEISGNKIMRTRGCNSCGKTFYTHEQIISNKPEVKHDVR